MSEKSRIPINGLLKATRRQVRVQILQRLYFQFVLRIFNTFTVQCTYKRDTEYIYVSIFIIVKPMDFQINVMRMAAYRSVNTGVTT